MAKRFKNLGSMVNQTKEKSIDQFVYRARAVLEHMFYDHTYCDIS